VRILLVHQTYPPGGGGSAVYTEALARTLARSHDVTVLCGSDDPGRPAGDLLETVRDGVRVVSLNRFPDGGFEAYRDPRVTAAARPLLDRVRPEVAHVGSLAGLSTGLLQEARRRGAAAVVTLHDFWPVCPLGQLLNRRLEVCPGPAPHRCLACVGEQVATRRPALRGLGRRLPLLAGAGRLAARATRSAPERIEERLFEMRAFLSGADRVLAPSRFLRDRLAALGIERVAHLPYGIPRSPAIPLRPDPQGRVRFGFLGAAIPSKGVHVLAAAFRGLGDSRAALRIHGGFPPYHGDRGYEARVRSILGAAAIDALRGPYAHADLPEILASLDVVVVPSLWEENAPLVVLEAFRARRPVLASDHGGLAELVREGVDGMLFPPAHAAALVATMRRLVEDGALRERLGRDPPHVPDMDEHAAALETVYAEARERHRARPGRVGVVVPDHGRPEDAAEAAASALDPTLDVRVAIVENGKTTTPVPTGQWEVLALPVNLGFAGAANAGVRHLRAAGCDRFLLLNNDAWLEPGALRLLAEALSDERLGAVGPVVLRESDGRVESRGLRVDPAWGRHRLAGHGEKDQERDAVVPADALSGVAVMMSLAAVERAGLLDEAYFHGFEDLDWCARLAREGLGLAVVLGARVRHGGARTLGKEAPARLYYAARNHVRATERTFARRGAARWARRLSIAGLNLAHALRQREVPRGQAVRAVLAGTGDAWKGRAGPKETP
jgi:GT2 family glycosyltransferase/glycosyltransferase involved in cell wall biosynthesis